MKRRVVLLVNRGAFSIDVAFRGASLVALGVSSWAGPVVLNTNLNVRGMFMTFSGPINGVGGMASLASARTN